MFFNKSDYRFQLTDMHSHILPGVDDGAADMNVAMNMMEIAYQDGIRTIVLTPHYHPQKCVLDLKALQKRQSEFERLVNKDFDNVKFIHGREVYYTNQLKTEIKDEWCIGYTRYILIEFGVETSVQEIRSAVRNIIANGKIPIIAHIERYMYARLEKELVLELRELGAVIQVNARPVIDSKNKDIKKYVKYLLSNELVDIIASDAHDSEIRIPCLFESACFVANKYSENYARRIFEQNPYKIIHDELIR